MAVCHAVSQGNSTASRKLRFVARVKKSHARSRSNRTLHITAVSTILTWTELHANLSSWSFAPPRRLSPVFRATHQRKPHQTFRPLFSKNASSILYAPALVHVLKTFITTLLLAGYDLNPIRYWTHPCGASLPAIRGQVEAYISLHKFNWHLKGKFWHIFL